MDEEEPNENDSKYVSLYQSHLEQFKDHLAGVDHNDGALQPSFFPPCGFWTSEEKGLFFHALSVHSKLRPDLIAEEIPGKTLVDVMTYLELLEAAIANEASRKRPRAIIEAAVEVSDKWVKFEEKASSVIIERELEWGEEYREEERQQQQRAKEQDLRAKSLKELGVGERNEERRRRYQAVKELVADMSRQWQKEDYMRQLSGPHLRTIDHILREAEEPSENRKALEQETTGHEAGPPQPYATDTNTVSDSVIDPALLALSRPATPPLAIPREQMQDYPSAASNPPTLCSTTLLPPTPSELHESPPPNQPQHVRLASPQDEPDVTAEALAILSPISRRRHQKRLYMRRKRAQATGGIVSASVARLKPGRKTNKKLERQIVKAKAKARARAEWERRQELEHLNGVPGTNGEEMKVDLDNAGFTIPVEETKEEFLDVNTGKEEFEISLHKNDSEGSHTEGDDEDYRHRNVGGETLPYKILRDFTDMGYDVDTLEADGLGLFHLTNLYKLMGLHASLRSVPDDVGTCISASTIQLLHAHVLQFLHKLIQQTIALREQEQKSKVHTKVWRFKHDLIKSSTVYGALEMMGAKKDKKLHFASLVDRITCLSETIAQTTKRHEREKEDQARAKERADAGQDEAEESRGSDYDEDEETEETESEGDTSTRRPLPILPVHRELNPPFVLHPSLDPLLPNPFRRKSAPEDESDLLPEEMDAHALLEEMLEEEEIDARDVEIARQEEAKLWERMRRKRVDFDLEAGGEVESPILPNTQPPSPDAGKSEIEGGQRRSKRTNVHSLRYAEPNARFGVKSTVFVEDSD